MGIPERKEREKHEKRRLILDNAMQLFIEEGYENVSIRKIADKIEYSPAAIYLYFKDKDEILTNLQKEGFEKFYLFLVQAESELDPKLRIKKLGYLYINFGLENPEYYDLMFIARAPMKKFSEGEEWLAHKNSFLVLQNTIEYAMEKGVIKKGHPFHAAFALWSFVHGIVALINRRRINELKGEDLQGLVDGAMESFLSEIIHK